MQFKYIYDLSYIHLYSSPSAGVLRTPNVTDQLPLGFTAQLVEPQRSWVRIQFKPEIFLRHLFHTAKFACITAIVNCAFNHVFM